MNAVIFDMDGVIVNSVSYKHEHRTRVIEEEFGLEGVDTDQLIGLNTHDKFEYLVDHGGLDVEKEYFLEQFDKNIERVYTEQVELLSGLEPTLDWLEERGVKAGLASASSRRRVELVIDRFGLAGPLDAVVSADDVDGPSKPDPAIYERAASMLEVEPSACLAIEDSAHGVTAATSAGMYCIGYAPEGHPPQDLDHADEIVTEPRELHDRVRALVERGDSGPA